MPKPRNEMTDRELIEDLHDRISGLQSDHAMHVNAHSFRDPMLDGLLSTIHGNGKLGLKTQVQLLWAGGGLLTTIVVGLVLAFASKLIGD